MTQIRDYFTHDRTRSKVGLDPALVELATLARGCAREGMLTLAVMPPLCDTAHGCLVCGSNEELMPMRSQIGHRTVVALFCRKCQKRVPVPHDSKFKTQVKAKVLPTGHGLDVEMAYLFRQGPRTQIVWGHDLNTEALS